MQNPSFQDIQTMKSDMQARQSRQNAALGTMLGTMLGIALTLMVLRIMRLL